MIQLPQEFIEKYTHLLGPDAQAFFESFESSAVSGFRTNPLKEQQKEFPDAIPNMPWSYFDRLVFSVCILRLHSVKPCNVRFPGNGIVS